jgi:hypothetical protein
MINRLWKTVKKALGKMKEEGGYDVRKQLRGIAKMGGKLIVM